jgi:hypothetical protein
MQKGTKQMPDHQGGPPPRPRPTRSRRDHERREGLLVEFLGGPFDGARLTLDVVRDDATHIRVLEQGYARVFRIIRAADVEQEAAT